MIETYGEKDVIIREGSKGTSAYTVVSGSVEVSIKKDNIKCVLAILGRKQVFGEMGLIEDKPRSATVLALEEDTKVSVMTRDNFKGIYSKDPTAILPIVKTLLERLRTTSKMTGALCESCAAKDEGEGTEGKKTKVKDDDRYVTITGLNDESKEELGNKTVEIKEFPYKVGRVSPADGPTAKDVLANNDFSINENNPPFYVSKNHFMIDKIENAFYVVDRGSKTGVNVNGEHVTESCFLDTENDSEIIVGTTYSPYLFKLTVVDPKKQKEKGDNDPKEEKNDEPNDAKK